MLLCGRLGVWDLCPVPQGQHSSPCEGWVASRAAQGLSPSLPASLQCARASMETLTLARFLCEMTLQEYDYARESPSKLAASCLLLALTMKNLGGWVSTCPSCSSLPSEAPQGAAVDRLVCKGNALGLCSDLDGWRRKLVAAPLLRGPSCPCADAYVGVLQWLPLPGPASPGEEAELSAHVSAP